MHNKITRMDVYFVNFYSDPYNIIIRTHIMHVRLGSPCPTGGSAIVFPRRHAFFCTAVYNNYIFWQMNCERPYNWLKYFMMPPPHFLSRLSDATTGIQISVKKKKKTKTWRPRIHFTHRKTRVTYIRFKTKTILNNIYYTYACIEHR